MRVTICTISASKAPVFIPCSANVCVALKKCSELSSNDFDGIHPTLRQVPPKVLYFSMMATVNPNCAALIAATYPPGPEPIIAKLYCILVFLINIIWKKTNFYLVIISFDFTSFIIHSFAFSFSDNSKYLRFAFVNGFIIESIHFSHFLSPTIAIVSISSE